MMTFLAILFVFMVAYGVAFAALLLPQTLRLRTFFIDVVYYPYMNVLGHIDFTLNQNDRKLYTNY